MNDAIISAILMLAFAVITGAVVIPISRYFTRRSDEAMETLRQANDFNRGILEKAPYPILIQNTDTSIRYVNPALEKLTGFSSAELLKCKVPYPFWTEETAKKFAPILEKELSQRTNKMTGEASLRKKNGEIFQIEVTGVPVAHNANSNEYFISVWVDITERKIAEEQLKKSNERFLSLADAVPAFVAFINASTLCYEYVNEEYPKLLGIPRDKIIGNHVRKVLGETNYQNTLKYMNEVKSGKNVSFEDSVNLASGKCHLQVNYAPFRGGDGTVEAFVVLSSDITQQKEMQKAIRDLYEKEKALRQELEEESKERGMFIDILGHELRTPLTPILASVGMLKESLPEGTPSLQKKLIELIDVSTKTMTQRLEELLDVARYSRGSFQLNLQSVNLKEFFPGVISRYRPSLAQNGNELITELASDLPDAEVDASRLEQVIINLLSNASKYGKKQGKIYLKIAMEESSLRFDVRDEGQGLSQDDLKNLFKPYHRTERDRKLPGLGLGLTICKQIAEAHGGNIWAESQIGEGTTFSVRVPMKAKSPQN